MSRFPITLDHPVLAGLMLGLALVAVVVARRRKLALGRWPLILGILAMLCLALAAGGLTWNRPGAAHVVVMVDLSSSTRGASFRQRTVLEKRIAQLVGQAPYRIVYFAQRGRGDAPPGDPLPDLPGPRTVFEPPGAVAILLFSDARFELPAHAPPTFVVADPNLEDVDDAAVVRLEVRSGQIAATAVANRPNRRVSVQGAATQPAATLEPGQITLKRPMSPDATAVAAQLSKGDLWPENDALRLQVVVPVHSRKWFISSDRSAPAADWLRISPDALPADSAQWLAPSVIVLDNIPADALSPAAQQRLGQFVRDLGGSLIIAGGDRALASGQYQGSVLESLSPLASTPPQPAIHWMLLADASGSMSQAVGSTSRWGLAANAIVSLLGHLPPNDPVTIGHFSRDLAWWTVGRTARQTAQLVLPPPGVAPNGPTNLAPALERIAMQADGNLVTELLVLSDIDTTIDDPPGLAQRLKSKNIRLHVLAIGEGGRGLDALQLITSQTGGTLRRDSGDPRQWAQQVRKLLADAAPGQFEKSPLKITFENDLAALASREIASWNRAWTRGDATLMAQSTHHGKSIPLAARWTLMGQVIATAFRPSAGEILAMSDNVARPPRDPRFAVTWDAGSALVVNVQATRDSKPWNSLPLSLELADAADGSRVTATPLQQTAPGRYRAAVDAPAHLAFATLTYQGRLIDRIAVPARYPAEFDVIGNDYQAMHQLARQTGGQVIDRATPSTPLNFPFPSQPLSLAPHLSWAASALLALALALWRRG